VALTDPSSPGFVYDEFGYLNDNCAEVGLELEATPPVVRLTVDVESGRQLSVLRWGGGEPELVFIHGSAQNAHTWDTVVLALGRSVLAVDLAGHGQSDWRDDRAYSPRNMAADVAAAIGSTGPGAKVIVGMSLGGMVATALASDFPGLVKGLVTVDVTPGVTREKAKHIHDFVAGPQTFASFAEIFDRTVQFNPTRSAASLRRGIVHNAYPLADGSWQWRYDRRGSSSDSPVNKPSDLWEAVDALAAPHLLVRGGGDGSVVDDEDVAELLRRNPASEVTVVPEAGHSIQGDNPLALAEIIETFMSRFS